VSTGGRRALVAAVRRELAEARGAARAVLAAAESARDESGQRRRRIRDAYATCVHQLATGRDTARLDIERRYRYESVRLAGSVRHVAAQSAAGAAGLPWRMWTPTEPADGRGPGLLRIGTLALDDTTALPGLVPLLDAAHLQLDGAPGEVDQVLVGLLLRALGSTRPGDVRLTVYDPGRTGDTFTPFTPLGVSFVGPGGLGSLLDALAEHIQRITETALDGAYRSLADLARATVGPRPEPWRIVVLLADRATAAELTGARRAQFDRVVRTGVACGVHLLVRGLDLPAHPSVHRLAVRDRTATGAVTGDLPIRLDQPPPVEAVASFCRTAAERLRTDPCTAALQ
jgi:S-DNA-T family DNA segregation ATPase FtsK/SpoIIIE